MRDLDELWDNHLELPIRGVVYRVEDPTAEVGLYCRRLWETSIDVARARNADDDQIEAARQALEQFAALPPPPGVPKGTDLWQHLLGAEYERMVAAGLPHGMIQHAGQTAIAWVAGGPEFAESYWLSAGLPNREAPNRAARRNQGKTSRSTAAVSKTRTRASTSTTSSPRKGARTTAPTSPGQPS